MEFVEDGKVHTGVSSRMINSELWNACAGPLVNLPQVGSLVFYFPQGHSEQVAFSTKSMATSQIPNYPILPPQMMCQVHSVMLHADKETDEVYAQMSLQPVNSEKDVFPIPDFGIRSYRHPSEFFCKTLTASDTSTHGGFSVPRRAAEKLFPPLDYAMQPPTQELIVRDLHDNTWTFRHIYRGQPKRHLLTTGWSLFVGAKRLRAGDSVLFIRDEKSQLLLGVRRACRQQKMLPSSVLSADSMHIGVLAAAAHAAANRSVFTIFYNPRACPSEFVIPLSKYKKSVHGTQLSAGMRFGMMFETEESGKRRYMGTVVGISDLDPLKWPGSKWRNIQVEWDEPGSGERQRRVSAWEIETPESHFIFPSITSGFKRPLHSTFWGPQSEWMNLIRRSLIQAPENDGRYNQFQHLPTETLCPDQFTNIVQIPLSHNDEPVIMGSTDPRKSNKNVPDLFFGPALDIPATHESQFIDRSEDMTRNPDHIQAELEPSPVIFPGPFPTDPSLQMYPAEIGFFHGGGEPPQGPWDQPNDGTGCLPPQPLDQFDQFNILDPGCFTPGLFPDDSNNQSGIYGCVNYETGSSTMVGPSVSSSGLEEYGHELPDSSGGTSTSNVDFDDSSLLRTSSWRHVPPHPPMRTYTKVQKTGSVGRSVDVTTFTGYDELCSAIEHMFGLEGLLSDQRSSGWKLVYVDYEHDVLLVGDDPWEEFVLCVRCIRILSPAEVHQMSEEGMQLLGNIGVGCPTVSTH